jgi:hypothetical protein
MISMKYEKIEVFFAVRQSSRRFHTISKFRNEDTS